MRALLERRFDVHVVHLLDPEEMNPELAGDLRLIDSETGEVRELTVDARGRARATASGCAQFLERVETLLPRAGDRLPPRRSPTRRSRRSWSRSCAGGCSA